MLSLFNHLEFRVRILDSVVVTHNKMIHMIREETMVTVEKKTSNVPTMNDYRHFHGMLCRPSTAFRCIQSFTGSALFMPAGGEHSIEPFDYTSLLNVATYYTLVFISCTGLLSLLGCTQCHVCNEAQAADPFVAPYTASSNSQLVVAPPVLTHLKATNPGSTSFILRRSFEYTFGGSSFLSVLMLHLQCNQGGLHLVEVYRIHNPLARGIFATLFDCVGSLVKFWGKPSSCN